MKTEEIFSLQDRVAIVTGSCGLIGRKHCEALAASGAHVVVADLNQHSCDVVASSLEGKHLALSFDVTSEEQVKKACDVVMNHWGQIDILINNAAINDMFENPALAAGQSKFENYPVEMFRKSLDVNVAGMFLCSQVFGAEMVKKKRGSIINVASTYGMVAPDQSIYINPEGNQTFYKSAAYPATKGAVISFTRFLAAYWGKDGVRVNTLSPGGVENSQEEWFVANYSRKTVLGRMATPTDYQGAVLFLASDASAYMTGANLVVDGGWTAI